MSLDDQGKALRMSKSYISNGIHSNRQMRVILELEYERQQDINQQREQRIERLSVTEIDRSLLFRADEDAIVSLNDKVPENACAC